MQSSSSRLVLFVLLVIFLVAIASSAPHDKHAECSRRVFRTINTLCNHGGDLETLRDMSIRCCKENCSMTDMLAACSSKPSSEEKF